MDQYLFTGPFTKDQNLIISSNSLGPRSRNQITGKQSNHAKKRSKQKKKKKEKKLPAIVLDFFRSILREQVIFRSDRLMALIRSEDYVMSMSVEVSCNCVLLIILAVDWPLANPIFVNLNADALRTRFHRYKHLVVCLERCRVSKNTPVSEEQSTFN